MRSFETLFHQYFEPVYRFACRLTRNPHEAEELTQQTFYKALKKIDSFEGRSDPVTWLCSIAKNEYYNQIRRQKEVACEPGSPVWERGGASAEEGVLQEEKRMQIHRQLHQMEEPYREVITLRIFGDLKYSQIASLFGKTESWARVTYYRARMELQNQLKEAEKDE